MKYIVVLGDGMSDYPVPALYGRTPLQAAATPVMDRLARQGELGLARTVPPGMAPGSDTANLSVLGYDPRLYYSGRSPFEAASMGVELEEGDMAFRCNLVTLSGDEPYGEKVMLDHSAGEITSAEAAALMDEVRQRLGDKALQFYCGVSFRHLLVWKKGPQDWQLTPPHDILGRKVGEFLPRGAAAGTLRRMMQESAGFLAGHEINKKRTARGLRPANAIWIWGEGKKPLLPSFAEKYGLRGAVISAVDLVRGIGVCAGLEVLRVEGATGRLDTNYRGKAAAAVAALRRGADFVFVHVEAPDECAHQGDAAKKVLAIELIDRELLSFLVKELERERFDYRLMVLPDHATPLSLRTHSCDPVPFVLSQSGAREIHPDRAFDEESAARTGLFMEEGHRLMDYFLQREAIK